MKSKRLLLLLPMMATIVSSTYADTLILVNYAGTNPQPVATTTFADYAVNDASITSGTVTQITGAFPVPTPTVGGLTITSASANGVFNTGNAGLADLAIYDSYIYDTDTTPQTTTISGLSSLSNSGENFTLTLYGIGDTDVSGISGTVFDVSYGATGLGQQSTSFAGTRFVQYTFLSNGTTDTIAIDWTQVTGGDTSGFNGFSLTTNPVPEPSTFALLGFGVFALALVRRKQK